MADVTDAAFRSIVAEMGKPDVMFTEFVSADGLMHPDGREHLLRDLEYCEAERPIVAQIFSSKPDNVRGAANLCQELGFDGVDINMGCPVRVINKQMAGAEMIKDHALAKEVIQAAKEGAPKLPVSVKSRIGYSSTDELEGWMTTLLEAQPAAITMHLRTKVEMSKVPAHWELASKLAPLRDSNSLRRIASQISPSDIASGDMASRKSVNYPAPLNHARGGEGREHSSESSGERALASGGGADRLSEESFFPVASPLLIANGDVKDLQDAKEKAENNNLDGVMLGRAIYGNPWLFSDRVLDDIPWSERLEVMLRHTRRFEEYYGPKEAGGKWLKGFATMRKFFGAYVSGHPEAKALKLGLMQTKDSEEVDKIVGKYI